LQVSLGKKTRGKKKEKTKNGNNRKKTRGGIPKEQNGEKGTDLKERLINEHNTREEAKGDEEKKRGVSSSTKINTHLWVCQNRGDEKKRTGGLPKQNLTKRRGGPGRRGDKSERRRKRCWKGNKLGCRGRPRRERHQLKKAEEGEGKNSRPDQCSGGNKNSILIDLRSDKRKRGDKGERRVEEMHTTSKQKGRKNERPDFVIVQKNRPRKQEGRLAITPSTPAEQYYKGQGGERKSQKTWFDRPNFRQGNET